MSTAAEEVERAASSGAIRPFADSLPMALLQARESAMRLFRPMLAEHDLTEQQWRVLRALAASADALEVGEIADATFLLGPSLTRILANLADRGLIDRQPVADDARRAAISLTAHGIELVDRVAPHSERIYGEIEATFGTADLRQLVARLNDLRNELGDLQ